MIRLVVNGPKEKVRKALKKTENSEKDKGE